MSVKIEVVTLVNGVRVDEVSLERILKMIESEQKIVERLESLKVKSNAITKLIDKHSTNIILLSNLVGKCDSSED